MSDQNPVVAKVSFQMTMADQTRHLIEVELLFVSDGRGGWVVRKAVPELCGGANTVFEGRGRSKSLAVIDWLRAVCGSMSYSDIPLYEERQWVPKASPEGRHLVPQMDFEGLD